MEVIRTTAAMQAHAETQRHAGKRLALVPTMGALHEGHLALVRHACRRAEHIIVSIFVNPTQFGPGEDYERYPRNLSEDIERLEAADEIDVDIVFAPTVGEMYPDGPDSSFASVRVRELDRHLCGSYRERHFEGVTTVVSKLFHLTKPHIAVFGRKDAQQFLILRRMVRELFFDVEVVGIDTIREPDGLALSSRNVYLSPAHREQATALSHAVRAAQEQVERGEQRVSAIVETMREKLAAAPDGGVQYAEVVDTDTLQPLSSIRAGQEVLAAVAVYFGETRLIDNAFATAPPA